MLSKIKIETTLTVLTGLHIGASNSFSAIGALDNPVVRDAWTNDPMIPGSSLKGKMRTLLAKSQLPAGKYVLPSCANDAEIIKRLFGTPGGKEENPKTARLQFCDAFLANKEQLTRIGGATEVKYENVIDRRTSLAMPRSMERVIRNAKFEIVWFYSVENPNEIKEDLKLLALACKLLSVDYLGGSGTRGYGRVGFDDFRLSCIPDEAWPCPEGELTVLFEGVKDYAASDL